MTFQNWANSSLPQWIPYPLSSGIPFLISVELKSQEGCPQERGVESHADLTVGLGDAGRLVWRLSKEVSWLMARPQPCC